MSGVGERGGGWTSLSFKHTRTIMCSNRENEKLSERALILVDSERLILSGALGDKADLPDTQRQVDPKTFHCLGFLGGLGFAHMFTVLLKAVL